MSGFHERIDFDGVDLVRTMRLGSWEAEGRLRCECPPRDPVEAWDAAILRGAKPSIRGVDAKAITIADLFCGAGGLSFGVKAACEALGLPCRVAFGGDQDEEALSVYAANLEPSACVSKSVSALVDYMVEGQEEEARFAYPPEVIEDTLMPWIGKLTVLVGGPPCQGHSSLNNHTRRQDPRNLLYLAMPALAVALEAQAVIIENVPEVRQDKSSVFETAAALLRSEGYHVDSLMMSATDLGVPQTRRRLFLVASRCPVDLKAAYTALRRESRSMWFAVGDLEDALGSDVFTTVSNVDAITQERIDYLFEHGLYELPNEMRPDCHKDGHSYPSVYGRLREDQPAGTITQGFNTIGRGRFIHPTRPRSLTPREAARLQGFPDSYRWTQPNGESWPRSTYAKLIGNAVPPPMGMAAMMAVLASLSPVLAPKPVASGM